MTIEQARELISDASRIIVLAGAGMSADVGVGTYWSGANRQYGKDISRFGFSQYEHAHGDMWNTHREEQIAFYSESLPALVKNDVLTADSPYKILLDYLSAEKKDSFVATSNVDAAFIRAGFDAVKVYEVHGNRLRSQCLENPMEHGVFATDINSNINTPCPICKCPSRPNCLFFVDFDFNPFVLHHQQHAFNEYKQNLKKGKTVILEIGAGTTIAAIRNQGMRLNRDFDIPIIRINLHELNETTGMENIIRCSKQAPILGIETNASKGLKTLLW